MDLFGQDILFTLFGLIVVGLLIFSAALLVTLMTIWFFPIHDLKESNQSETQISRNLFFHD